MTKWQLNSPNDSWKGRIQLCSIRGVCWDKHINDDMLLDNPACVLLLALGACSETEQKIDQIAAELTKRQLEREDTALQYKRYLLSWV